MCSFYVDSLRDEDKIHNLVTATQSGKERET
jgi:hypothetical protein